MNNTPFHGMAIRLTKAKWFLAAALAAAMLGGAPRAAVAQDQMLLQEAVKYYDASDYANAAQIYYQVFTGSTNPEFVQRSQYYLGRCMQQMGLLISALNYYGMILEAGAGHAYYLDAIKSIVALKQDLRDDTLVPYLLDKAYSADIGKLQGDDAKYVYEINYIVGAYQYRRQQYGRAKDWLNAVKPESERFAEAQYYLGLIAFRANSFEEAIQHFEQILGHTQKVTGDDPRAKEIINGRNLAILALARTYYGQGNYKKALEFYEKVPRFSDVWANALFEGAWAYFQDQQFGRTLGHVHSLHSPHFENYFLAETWILKATSYFFVCHFQAAEQTVGEFYQRYNPVIEKMDAFMAKAAALPSKELVDVLKQSNAGNGPIPKELAMPVFFNPRFQRFAFVIDQLGRERAQIEGLANWKGNRMSTEILGSLTQQSDQLLNLAGQFVFIRAKDIIEVLKGFQEQAKLIEFEIAKAKKVQFEANTQLGAIALNKRPKLPDGHYHMSFDNEYWRDELGYFQVAIGSKCGNVESR